MWWKTTPTPKIDKEGAAAPLISLLFPLLPQFVQQPVNAAIAERFRQMNPANVGFTRQIC